MGGFNMNEYATGAKKRLVVSATPAKQAGSAAGGGNVDHIVAGEVDGVGFEVLVPARDGLWAMSLVATMTEAEFSGLRRVEAGAIS
jgi:hypothetical protein